MRRAIVMSVLLALALAATGCGGDGGGAKDDRTPTAIRLAELCDAARADIEVLGLPSENGPQVIKRWAARGTTLVSEIRAIEGGPVAERVKRRALSAALDQFYRGLALGAAVYAKTKSSEAYAAAIDRAKRFRTIATRAATGLGVLECATEPFAEES